MSGEVSETRPTTTGYANRSTKGVAIHARSHHGARDRSKRAANPFGCCSSPRVHSPILQFRCRDRRTSDLDGSPHRKLIVTATRPPTPLRLLRLRRGGFVGDDSST